MSEAPGTSFSQGVGQWIGAAEVYDAVGRFAGSGRDTRTVEADHGEGVVTVSVTFEGPFSMSGRYTIADRGSHRLYQGPLNYGYAEALGDGLVCAHNYWHDHGLSQRFFLMVLPDGSRQLSLAILDRGEQLRWTVVGEYRRRTDPDDARPPAAPTMDPTALADDPSAGRAEILLHRPGRWTGDLAVSDGDLSPAGTTAYVEALAHTGGDLEVELTGSGFAGDARFELATDDWSAWTPPGRVVGSYSLSGGRGLSGSMLHHTEGLRCWRREVAALDGTMKGVVHSWYRGEERIGLAHGVLAFEPG